MNFRVRQFLVTIRTTLSGTSAGTVKDQSAYDDPGTRLFLADDDLAGAAAGTKDGDLASMFKHPTSTAKILPILRVAADAVAALNAYDGGCPQ